MRSLHSKMIMVFMVLFSLWPASSALAAASSVDVRVSTGSGDAEEDALGAMTLNDAELNLGGAGRRVGLHFAAVDIPRYANITAAYIQFTTYQPDSSTTAFYIEAEASDNPAGFSNLPLNILSRSVYNETVYWAPAEWSYNGYTDTLQNSADIKTLVQKIVNRPNWNPNNAMAFMIAGTSDNCRRAQSYDDNPSKAPKLHIEWNGSSFERRIQAGSDDMYQYSTSTISNGTNVNVANLSLSYCAGLRFQSVNIPEGAVITNAYITLMSKAAASAGAADKTISIWGEKRLNPPTFSTLTSSSDSIGKRKGLNLTAQTIAWNNLPAWNANQSYSTIDLKAIVQELVGQSGWDTSNKAMVFFMSSATESRSAYSFEGWTALCPLLHIDYLTPAPGESGSPVMAIPTEFSNISRTCAQGELPMSRYFELLNTGSATLNYSVATTYSSGSNWLSLTPAAATGTVSPGVEQHFKIDFNSAVVEPGTYHATVTFTSTNLPAPSPASQSIEVYLTVDPAPAVSACDDLPVYTRQNSSPAVLILLDLSQSMNEKIYSLPDGYQYPKTPDIKSILSEIVRYAGWQSGNALTIFFQRVSGTGKRQCWAYDGFSGWAPLLHVEYTEPDNVLPRTLDLRISQSKDDGSTYNGSSWNTGWQTLELGAVGTGYGVALRFPNVTIPYNATITKAYIEMVPATTAADTLNMVITGHQSANSGELTDMIPMNRTKTAASVNWSVESWTGIIAQSKMEIAKQAISTLVASEAAVSWGFGTWAQFDPYPEPIPAKVASEADRTYTRIHVGCAPYTAAHLTKLQAAIANTTHQSGSDTPFAPSILGAKKYFGAQMPDDELKTFVSNSCQPKVLVNVTDGRGNVPVDVTGDAYLALVDSRVRELLASGVNAVGVGFGMGPEGDIRAQLQRLAELSNTEGRKSPADALYPLHLEDGNGKGLPYFAQNKGELSEALQVIASSVKQAVFYGSAPAGTSVSDLGSMVLVSSFSTSDWSGDLQAITRDDQKRWNNQLWRASENVPANRKIWTLNDSNQIVEYSGYNYFCKPFGDIINSQPVVVGPPPYFYRVNNYNTFVLDKRSHPREPMVYFGANDGLVHALRLADGVEQWAFLPKSVRQRLEQAPIPAAYDRCSPYYCHSYLLDGPPKLADVYENFGSVNKTWQTMLVIGQRSGGSSYTALAVTEGHPFGYDGYAPANHLWEFTDAKLGEAWSEPEIEVTAAYEDMCYPWKYTWGVFLGSGYFKNANDWNCQSAYVFGLKADTGTPMWRNQSGTPINKVELLASGFRTKNAACSPLVAYMNLASGSLCYANRAMPRIYVGDLYGTLYRLNGIHYGSNPHQTRLFQFDPWPTSPDVNPIRGKPTYAYGDKDDHIWIYYGTGRYETEADKTNAAQQYFFGLRELTAPALGFTNVEPTYNLSRLVPREVYNVDVTVNGVTKTLRTINGGNANGNSWYVKLKVPQSGGSERVFTKPLAVGGVVFFTTFIPDADGCSGSGDTYLFAIDYKTGLAPANPVMDINGDNKVNDADKVSLGGGNPPVVPVGVRLGRGQGSTPVLFKNTIFVTTTVAQYGTTGTENANLGGLHAVLVDLPNFKVRTESWKHNGNATEPVEGEL